MSSRDEDRRVERQLKALLCAACLVVGALFSSVASSQAPLESAVKAAYIYRFLEYVAWPAPSFRTAEDPIVIGTTHSDEVSAELNRMTSGRTVHNRRLVVTAVKQFERDSVVHVLYVPAGDVARSAKLIEAARQRPILVITDIEDGLDRGATINFVQSEGRIKFEVSVEAAGRAGLTISARLLAVATRVKKGEYRPPVYAWAHAAAVEAGVLAMLKRHTITSDARHFACCGSRVAPVLR